MKAYIYRGIYGDFELSVKRPIKKKYLYKSSSYYESKDKVGLSKKIIRFCPELKGIRQSQVVEVDIEIKRV